MITFTRFKIVVISISLLAAAMVWAPFIEAAPKIKSTDNSDLTKTKLSIMTISSFSVPITWDKTLIQLSGVPFWMQPAYQTISTADLPVST